MIKPYYLLLIFGILLAACSDGALSVSEYNEKAMNLYNPLDTHLGDVMEHITANEGAKEPEIKALKGVAGSIDSVRAELVKLKVPQNAMPMHQALMQFINYEKDTLVPLLAKVIESKYSEDAVAKMYDESDKAGKRTKVLSEAVESEQKKLENTISK